MDELELVDWLCERLAGAGPDVVQGPGDDCALLDMQGVTLAATTDALLEGVHFRAEDPAQDVGWKAVACGLSDLAGMGCAPRWGLCAVGLRRGGDGDWARGLAEGMAACARKHGLALVGGDVTAGDGPASVTVTALGRPLPGGPVRRSGAQPGDIVAVTGALGGSGAGRHLSFAPRLAESERLCASEAVTAMMDLSDGLALDLKRLTRASQVGARVEAGRVPVHPDAEALAAREGTDARMHALTDGEDFELLLTVRAQAWDALASRWSLSTPLVRIGRCTEADRGLVLVDETGQAGDWPGGGYVHALD